MDGLKAASEWARIVLPFLAAILSGINTYEARSHVWRFTAGIASTVILVAIGCAAVYFRLAQ